MQATLMDTLSVDSALLGNSESPALENLIQSLISKAEANVFRINSQIRDLTCERERALGNIAKLRAKIAPIRKVPAELLVETFSLVAYGGELISPPSSYRKDVLRMSQVCTFWRQLVHNTPRLWTAFCDIRGGRKKKFSEQYLALMQTWITRSAPFPIPIHISCDAPGVERVLKSLFPSANRWKSLHLDCNRLSSLATLPPGSLEMLEKVHLEGKGRIHPPVEAFLTAPLLRRVHLSVDETLHIPMPWSQLTSLDLHVTSFNICREILIECTNIVEATLYITVSPSNAVMSELPVRALPHLEALSITFEDAESGFLGNSAQFFQSLALPALKELDLSFIEETDWDQNVFTEFQLRAPNIERFEAFNSPMSSGDLIAFLRHAPALRELKLGCCYVLR